ncbi:MAG TPA: DUF1778 domain-containing protein [Gemmatimonadaceae bacterium]|jgi:hypothetical protein
MSSKSEHLQIRVTARQKAMLKQAAAAAGQDVSTYVLARAIPDVRLTFAELLGALRRAEDHRYVLAELNDFLATLAPSEFRGAVETADVGGLSPFLANYVAAMVEQGSHLKGISAPPWTREVAPLRAPWFATPMNALRFHLLRASPVAFKRRNLFVDASVGARV